MVADAGAPRCPDWLDEVAKEEWNRVGVELANLGSLTSLDGAALVGLCHYYSLWVRASKQVNEISDS